VRELLTDEEYAGLQWHLALRPKAGEVIQDTGGLRKVFQIIQKAREISEGSQIALPQLKAAAASTGLTAIGWGRSR